MANKSTIIALIWCCSWSRNNLVKKYPLTPHHQPLSCQISTKLRAEISITGGLYLVLAAIVVLRRDNSGKMMIRRFSVEEKHQVRTHSYLLDLLINEIRNLKFDLIAVRNILPHPWDSNYLDQRQNEWFQFGNHDFLFCRLSLESACGGRGLFRWFCDGRHGKWDIQFLLNRRFIVIPLIRPKTLPICLCMVRSQFSFPVYDDIVAPYGTISQFPVKLRQTQFGPTLIIC